MTGADRVGEIGDGAVGFEAVDSVENGDAIADGRIACDCWIGEFGADDVGEDRAGLDRLELEGVADEHDGGVVAHCGEQFGGEGERHHRHLVDDHQIMGQALGGAMAELGATPAPAE